MIRLLRRFLDWLRALWAPKPQARTQPPSTPPSEALPACTVVHITEPEAYLGWPALFALIARGLASSPFCEPRGALRELADLVAHPDIGLLVALVEGEPKGFVLLQSSHGLLEGCLALQFVSEGGPRVRRRLVEGAIAFARERKNERIIGIDTNQRPQAFCRVFALRGLTVASRGTAFEFQIQEI